MAKSSKVDAARHRDAIVSVAARLLRERGESGVSVQAIMAEVGLTHGGFYKHFGSKDELMTLAAELAFSDLIEDMSKAGDGAAAWSEFVNEYLSEEQRRDVAGGCASTALASDVIRAGDASGLREAYVAGVEKTLLAIRAYHGEPESEDARAKSIKALITMVGALTLSRATAGSPLADEFVAAARSLLSPPQPEGGH